MTDVTEAMVERAAKALHDHRHPTFDWDAAAEYMTKMSWREQARVALAAALNPPPDPLAYTTHDDYDDEPEL